MSETAFRLKQKCKMDDSSQVIMVEYSEIAFFSQKFGGIKNYPYICSVIITKNWMICLQ